MTKFLKIEKKFNIHLGLRTTVSGSQAQIQIFNFAHHWKICFLQTAQIKWRNEIIVGMGRYKLEYKKYQISVSLFITFRPNFSKTIQKKHILKIFGTTLFIVCCHSSYCSMIFIFTISKYLMPSQVTRTVVTWERWSEFTHADQNGGY